MPRLINANETRFHAERSLTFGSLVLRRHAKGACDVTASNGRGGGGMGDIVRANGGVWGGIIGA